VPGSICRAQRFLEACSGHRHLCQKGCGRAWSRPMLKPCGVIWREKLSVDASGHRRMHRATSRTVRNFATDYSVYLFCSRNILYKPDIVYYRVPRARHGLRDIGHAFDLQAQSAIARQQSVNRSPRDNCCVSFDTRCPLLGPPPVQPKAPVRQQPVCKVIVNCMTRLIIPPYAICVHLLFICVENVLHCAADARMTTDVSTNRRRTRPATHETRPQNVPGPGLRQEQASSQYLHIVALLPAITAPRATSNRAETPPNGRETGPQCDKQGIAA
jgi:hypothetical protein